MLGISERSKIESIVVGGKGNRSDPTDVGWGDGGGGLDGIGTLESGKTWFLQNSKCLASRCFTMICIEQAEDLDAWIPGGMAGWLAFRLAG